MRSPEQTFLVVRVACTKDFIGLRAAPDLDLGTQIIQIGFPLITERQRALAGAPPQASGYAAWEIHPVVKMEFSD